jgi:hypothetical protein
MWGVPASLFTFRKGVIMSASVAWRDNWSAALEEAKKADRPLVLEFHMEG